MGIIYPQAICLSSAEVGEEYQRTGDSMLVPWGWNVTLKYELMKQGIPEQLLPSDETLDQWRQLQHRTTLLSLQPYSCQIISESEAEELLSMYHDIVLKAPWSGSGRGLRWVSNRLSDHDKAWFAKVVREQHCAIAEPRWKVQYDFALEYRVEQGTLSFVGYSLFDTVNGVYRGNRLLSDDAIVRLVGFTGSQRDRLERWLQRTIVPHYNGPLGVDCILDKDGHLHFSEINLRHTMGLVAHEYLRRNPMAEGSCFSPSDYASK